MNAEADWYETIPFADGITLIHEPWMPFFFRCTMWLVRGSERDMLVDTGLGAVPLRRNVPALRDRPVVCVTSHTHFDHIGMAVEFEDRLVHPLEAPILADPANDATLFDHYAEGGRDAELFLQPPAGWDATAYRIAPAPATQTVEHGDTVDLGDRRFTVLHTPGHSPGHIALWEEVTGTLIAQDVIYDGPLVTDCAGADMAACRASTRLLSEIEPRIVHGGHFPRRTPDAALQRPTPGQSAVLAGAGFHRRIAAGPPCGRRDCRRSG